MIDKGKGHEVAINQKEKQLLNKYLGERLNA